MKNILKNALLLLSLSCFTACEINDPVDDWARTGQQVPHTIWELSSTKVKAGDSLAFKAQYYTNGEEIENMAVYYNSRKGIVYLNANNGGIEAYYNALWAVSPAGVANVYIYKPDGRR